MIKMYDKIKNMLTKIDELDLMAPSGFYMLTLDALSNIYNGAGPDWMSSFSRKILTFLLRYFAAAFLIHDVEFYFNDNRLDTPENRAEFDRVNREMWTNIKKLCAATFAWYNPRRWYWRLKGYAAYRACQDFGWSAWIAVGSEANNAVIETKKLT